MKNTNVTVQTSLMPFRTTFTTASVENCKTVQDVVKLSVPFNFRDCKLVVTHNGKIIECEQWEVTKVKNHDLVGLNFIPMGGGGGKNLGQLAVMVALTVATIYTAGMASAAWGAYGGAMAAGAAGITTAAGAFISTSALLGYAVGYTALTIGIGMLGSMAMNALASTPKQSGRANNLAESTTSFIEGARNAMDKYGIIPVNLGTNRMYPKLAATIYTESAGKNQYSRQLFTYGYGKLLVADRKFGETDVSDFDEVEFEDKLDGNLNTGVGLYSNDVYQQDYNVLLSKEVGYVLRTTQTNTDEVEIDITFQGLCKYNDSGARGNATVEFEVQYAPTGTDNWSIGASGTQIVNSQTLTEDLSKTLDSNHHKARNDIVTNTFIVMSLYNGLVYTQKVSYQVKNGEKWPSLSNDEVVLGYIRGETRSNHNLTYVDNHAALTPKYINSVNDFPVTVNTSDKSNVIINVGSGTIKGVAGNLKVTASTAQSLRKSKRIKFPTRGQYDIRIRRLTNDSTDDKLIDKAYLTAIRSIEHVNPVNFADISGTAMRIKATDQLSGAVDSYNAIVSTYVKSYNPTTEQWDDDVISSNPADIFRYVLQSPAFAKALPDERIDLDKLAEWWVYCDSMNLTYDRVIDYETSIDDVLNDICAAGLATLSKVDNIYSVIIDNERPIVKGMVTPRNSWDYKGNITYPDLPHALRVEFRNADAGYETDERIVYADGYDESNATLYERLQFMSCTDADLAYWYGRRYFATALLQPETHTFKMDFEHMTFNRGDRITLVNDVILVGVGQGRIKELITANNQVTGFVIDDELNIPSDVNNLAVRIRDNDVTQGYTYYLLEGVEGVTNEFTFATPIAVNNAPAVDSLCAFVEDGKELDLIITGIKPNKDQSATITAIDYAPDRFNPVGDIPEWQSNITISTDFYKPHAPVLMSDVQTDESVMIKNSDGSLTSVAVVQLLNRNEDNVNVIVNVRKRDTTEWYVPSLLKKDPNELIITGLQDGEFYDFEIRYQRQSGLMLMSDPLTLTDIQFIGGSTIPADVQNFRVTVTNGLGLFEWSPSEDIDLSHYIIRYSADTENVTWEGSQITMDKITSTSITNVIHKGMYLIKAIDMLGNESENASTITVTDEGAYRNLDQETIQDPTWGGSKTNITVTSGQIRLTNPNINEGFYYFTPATIDLGAVYEVSLSANVKAVVEKRNKVRDIDYIRNVLTGIRDFGAGINSNADWSVELQMNLSNDNSTWSGWQPFIASQMRFRAVKFRLRLYSASVYITPNVSIARVYIDMPDRYESGEDITMTSASTGGVITYNQAFRNNPSVNITVQNGAVDDKIEFVTKNNKGFTFKVFNATLNTYVTRTFDYIAAGYGREVE